MKIPASTYRVQLHKGFTLRHLYERVDYIHQLGISTIYAAPILKSNPGSIHGYDVVDPYVIDPEIGTIKDLRRISKILKDRGMTWLQDIVPNHMAFSTSNERLMDVLERGAQSPFYEFFDIDWNHPNAELHGRVQVPFLGKELTQCIHDRELKISFSGRGFTVDYFQLCLPLSIQTYSYLFSRDKELRNQFTDEVPAKRKITLELWKLKKQLMINALLLDSSKHQAVIRVLNQINGSPSDLHEILRRQNYSLAYWKRSEQEINYRRFFTVNELICLRMEEESVFKEYHQYLKKLFDDGLIQGFRIDHIDGLKDPSAYAHRLRQFTNPDCYIIAEKILEHTENIPQGWPIQGTSGYEFLAMVSQLLTNREGARKLLTFYQQLFPNLPPYREIVLHNKRKILRKYMGGEWENLATLFSASGLQGNYDRERLKDAIGIFMVYLPVYRIYPDHLPLTGNDRHLVEKTFRFAIDENPEHSDELRYLRGLFLDSEKPDLEDEALSFLQRLMQFTGPLTAKGVEDTTFYIYNALISHDEVGDSPSTLGISVESFHAKMIQRQRFDRYSLNTTSTHDTKRGEDARIRLNVLCEFSEQWAMLAAEWFEINKVHKAVVSDRMAPSLNDEYFIYQSLVGGFPEDLQVTEEFVKRLQEYQTKVVREAKVYSDWSDPDERYESACGDFIRKILSDGSDFLKSFLPFMRMVAERASIYALSQLVIKLTAPGIPDTYQGCELWDLSFVDPDNRRPVDFEMRKSLLTRIASFENQFRSLAEAKQTEDYSRGVEKLFVLYKLLNFRKRFPDLFAEGEYKPISVESTETAAIAYTRCHGDRWVLVIVPLGKKLAFSADDANQEQVQLPENSPDHWTNLLTGEVIQTQRKLMLSRCFGSFPVAVLVNEM